MKYLSNLIPILTAFLLTFTVLPAQVQAQQAVDGNRLNRDINIMESVLSEMFRMRSTGTSSQVRVVTAFSSRSNGVRGTYLPDYGLIFQIDRPSSYLVVSSDENTESNMVFQYGETESGEQEAVTRESVTSRIVEFLQDYGSTIGQLDAGEHVMVIYGGMPGSTWSNNFNLFSSSTGSRISSGDSANRLPVISVSAQMSDLSAYRRGDLNDQQFRSRVSVSETEPNDAASKDMRVMANIFETAFENNDDGFKIRGSVDYLLLDNFGALFFFDASYGSAGAVFRLQSVPSLRAGSDSNSSRAVAVEEMRKTLEEQREEAEQKREETRQKTVAAYETFKTDLREYLVDYGRTLSSVDTDQHVLLSIKLNTSVEGIPDRIDVQVAKSVLERMDRGNLSRQEAMSQVSLREY